MLCLIINYNRLEYPRNLADWALIHGLEPVFIDNNSDYKPLLDYYGKTKYQVLNFLFLKNGKKLQQLSLLMSLIQKYL